LQTHGDAALRGAFERGLAEQAIGAEYIAHYLGTTVPTLPFDDTDRPPTISASWLPRAGRVRPPKAPAGPEPAEGLDAAEHGGIRSARWRPVMIAGDTDLDALFKRLHLANARRVWRQLVERAERESWAYRDFLTPGDRGDRPSSADAACAPDPASPLSLSQDDRRFQFHVSVVVMAAHARIGAGPGLCHGRPLSDSGRQPGRGKTHLAIAIAYRVIQNGFDAFFTTAATLIDDLSAAFRTGELAQALPTYTHPAVLVVDEVGYLTYGTDAANMLFHVVNERHRRHRSMIFTTNKALKAWGRVLHDEDLAQAIIDRVLERGRLLRLDGPSVRTLHVNLDDAMKDESDPASRLDQNFRKELPRISGTHNNRAFHERMGTRTHCDSEGYGRANGIWRREWDSNPR
jgi:hypothetical protein